MRLENGAFPRSKIRPVSWCFLIMRFNIKAALIFFTAIIVIAMIIMYNVCNQQYITTTTTNTNVINQVESIDCDINNEYLIDCKRIDSDIYVPFTFLERYFEIYGKLTQTALHWQHSYGKLYHPKAPYDPRGVFMYFENYNVEVRDRVKCVSGQDGVPVSTQWESGGYFYPTQIAQFGLSHWSKNLTEPEPRRVTLDDGGDTVKGVWKVPATGQLLRPYHAPRHTHVVEFHTSDIYTECIELSLDHVLDLVLQVTIALQANSSLTVIVENRETKDSYQLHYISGDLLMTSQGSNVYHGIGTANLQWRTITRDLAVDLYKGLKLKVARAKVKVVTVTLRGSGMMDNLTLATSEHLSQFYAAADWFVHAQHPETGGWVIPVKRTLAPGFAPLEPGWVSAMGQGHALSLLARAYHHSQDRKYLHAALNGLKPFRVASSDGGVVATFLDHFTWYEEYPTTPASYVLNGFIFSLIGLHDLRMIASTTTDGDDEADRLCVAGLATLRRMLPLFDTGSGTSYDLRHFTVVGVAPNLARWDYHATHVNQLLVLATIDDDDDGVFRTVAARWEGYMSGKRANHN